MPGETAEIVISGSQTKVGSSQNTAFINWNGTADAKNYDIEEKFGTLTVHKKKPPIPPKPPGPSNPSDPSKPENPNNPSTPSGPRNPSIVPQTGDRTNFSLYICMLIVTGIILLIGTVRKKLTK